jgi:hypothetical protein
MLASHATATQFGLLPKGLPLVEVDRFFAAPHDGRQSGVDAQARALDRLIRNCAHLRPHLQSVEALEDFIESRRSPARVRTRINEALIATAPEFGNADDTVGARELEAFRSLARRMPATLVWVFS